MIKKITKISLIILVAYQTSGCARPLLKEIPEGSAEVTLINNSSGYFQAVYFDDPLSCSGQRLIGHIMQPSEQRVHQLPSNKTITLLVGAYGVSPGVFASWCEPVIISTRLSKPSKYEVSYNVDSANKKCFVNVIEKSKDGSLAAKIVKRNFTGPDPVRAEYTCAVTDSLQVINEP